MKNYSRSFFTFLAGLLILLATVTTAQKSTWDVVMQVPSVMFNDLHFLPDGLHGWAVGSTSEGGYVLTAILKTTDGGQSWNKVNFSASNSVALNTVFFVNPDTGWVAGPYGTIYKTVNAGMSWSSQSGGTGRTLAKIFFISDNEGWITGGWGDGNPYLVLHTINGGTTWENQSFGNTSFSTEDIFFINGNTGWISGRDNTLAPHIHKTINGGQTWTRQTVPLSSSNTAVVSIEFANENKGWAATSSIYATPAGAVLFTEDGGENWSVQTYTNQSYNYLSVRDADNVAVVGITVLPPADEKVLVTNDGGLNWDVHSTPIKSYTFGIQYKMDEIWLASINSTILHSTDNANSWEWQNISAYLRSMPWRTDDVGYAISGSSAGTDNYTYHTTDGGLTWPADLEVPGGAQGIFFDDQTGWMLWEGNSARVWRTVDGGNSWSPHYIGSGGKWTGGITFANPDTGWVYGSAGNLRFTADGGQTWSAQSPGISDYIQDAFFVSSNSGWAAGGYGGGNGFIINTNNAGTTWHAQTTANSNHILDLFFLNENEGWATEVGGGIQHTTDGGHVWQFISSVPHSWAQKIFMIDPLTGWLIANNGSDLDGKGFIYRTDDGGGSWALEYESPWPNSNLSEISLQTGGILWVCGTHNTLLRYSDPVGIEEKQEAGIEVFPNPTNGKFKIQNSKFKINRVELVDLNGRVAMEMEKRGIGEEEITIDNSHLTAGVYFCRIQSGNQIVVKKIILLK